MDGRIPRAVGRYVNSEGKVSIVYNQSPEERAFQRWREGEFLEVEQQYASSWRKGVAETDLRAMAKSVKEIGINGQTCKMLAEAKAIADRVTQLENASLEPLRMATLAVSFQ